MFLFYLPNIFAPNTKVSKNNTRKIKNNILAIDAAPAAIPVNPNIAAMMAITKNIMAHLSIINIFSDTDDGYPALMHRLYETRN